jgi:hypothetical protein
VDVHPVKCCEDLGKFTNPHAPLTYTSGHCQDISQSSLPYNLHSQLHSPSFFARHTKTVNCQNTVSTATYQPHKTLQQHQDEVHPPLQHPHCRPSRTRRRKYLPPIPIPSLSQLSLTHPSKTSLNRSFKRGGGSNQSPCVECPCDVSPAPHPHPDSMFLREENNYEGNIDELMPCDYIELHWTLSVRQQRLLLRSDDACAAACDTA